MKKVNVKRISVENVSMPLQHLVDASTSLVSRTGREVAAASEGTGVLRSLIAPTTPPSVPRQELVKVTLDLEEAYPTADSVNVWIGDQLLLGTMLHEETQQLTGYLRHTPDDQAEVRLEFADGAIKRFDLPTQRGG